MIFDQSLRKQKNYSQHASPIFWLLHNIGTLIPFITKLTLAQTNKSNLRKQMNNNNSVCSAVLALVFRLLVAFPTSTTRVQLRLVLYCAACILKAKNRGFSLYFRGRTVLLLLLPTLLLGNESMYSLTPHHGLGGEGGVARRDRRAGAQLCGWRLPRPRRAVSRPLYWQKALK